MLVQRGQLVGGGGLVFGGVGPSTGFRGVGAFRHCAEQTGANEFAGNEAEGLCERRFLIFKTRGQAGERGLDQLAQVHHLELAAVHGRACEVLPPDGTR